MLFRAPPIGFYRKPNSTLDLKILMKNCAKQENSNLFRNSILSNEKTTIYKTSQKLKFEKTRVYTLKQQLKCCSRIPSLQLLDLPEHVLPAVDDLLHLPPLPQQLQGHQARLVIRVLFNIIKICVKRRPWRRRMAYRNNPKISASWKGTCESSVWGHSSLHLSILLSGTVCRYFCV